MLESNWPSVPLFPAPSVRYLFISAPCVLKLPATDIVVPVSVIIESPTSDVAIHLVIFPAVPVPITVPPPPGVAHTLSPLKNV